MAIFDESETDQTGDSSDLARVEGRSTGDGAASAAENPYVLLRPLPPERVWKPEIDSRDIILGASVRRVQEELRGLADCDVAAIDLETCGTDISDPDTYIVGVGVAWRVGEIIEARYFEYTSMCVEARRELLIQLARAETAIAHNLYFDGAWLWRESVRLGVDAEPRWMYCTYGLYRQLANEGWPSQRWGLKNAQRDLLGWSETNDLGVRKWLIENGYTTTPIPKRFSKEDKDNGPAQE